MTTKNDIHEINLPILNALKDIGSEKYNEYKEKFLIAEAKKRGYKDGVTITWKNKPKLIYTLGDGEFDYLISKNVLVFGNYGIFERGEWAEIITQEKTVVPMEKALKIIAKKMKVSPENIEIKN